MRKHSVVRGALFLALLAMLGNDARATMLGSKTPTLPTFSPEAVLVTMVIFMAGLAIVLWRWVRDRTSKEQEER